MFILRGRLSAPSVIFGELSILYFTIPYSLFSTSASLLEGGGTAARRDGGSITVFARKGNG